MPLLNFLNIWNAVAVILLTSVFNVWKKFSVKFWLIDFFPSVLVILSCTFECLIIFDGCEYYTCEYCEYYILGCYMCLYSYKSSWTLFWDAVRSFLILLLKCIQQQCIWASQHRASTPKRCPFHYRGLECKSRKSRNAWGNRQIWPWSTEWSRAKSNRVLPREHTGHSNTLFQQHKRRLYTWTSPDSQHLNQTDYILCSQRWRSSIQSGKIRLGASWLWLRSWTPYCQIQT